MLEALHRLVAHLRWADRRMLDSLRRASPPPARAVEIFAHVLGAEHVWLARLAQQPARFPVWPALSLDGCASMADANAGGLEAFVRNLGPDDLARLVPYTNSAGQRFESSVADMLLQLFTHSSYHRGQVAMLLRDQGGEPAATDFIAFVRGAPAATRR